MTSKIKHEQKAQQTAHGADDRQLASLFSHASARPRPPEEVEARIRAATESEWQILVGRRRTRRHMFAFGLAASVVIALTLAVQILDRSATTVLPEQIASVAKLTGTVTVLAEEATVLSPSSALHAGQTIVTGPGGRLGLVWNGGASVRLDENSRVELLSPQQVRLLHGRLYVDVEPGLSGITELNVLTEHGLLRHVGTQYMADWNGSALLLSVREGAVEIGGTSAVSGELATAGDRLRLAAGQPVVRDQIASNDPAWDWTHDLAPSYAMDGSSLHDFAAWVGRETGHAIDYANAESERVARETILSGNLDLEPSRALDAILQTSDLVAESSGQRIMIRLKS